MEIREIEAFLTLAEELHFGRTAERLHRTTSNLSQTIKLLERRVGGALFDRSSRSVTLTPLGEQFRADLAPCYDAVQDALRRARAAAQQAPGHQVLRVATTTTVTPELISRAAESFRARSNAEVIWQTMPYDQVFHWYAKTGPIPPDTDVLMSWVPAVTPEIFSPARLTVGPVVATTERELLMHRSHPLAGRAGVDVEELTDHRLLFPAIDNKDFADAWCPPATPAGRPVERVDGDFVFPEELPRVLSAGLLHITGVGVYRRALNFPGLLTVPLTGMPPFLLVTTWPTAIDSALIRSFAAAAAVRRSG